MAQLLSLKFYFVIHNPFKRCVYVKVQVGYNIFFEDLTACIPICCIQSILECCDSMSWGRFVSLWSSIAPPRVETEWWDSTLLLKQLEATATLGPAGTATLLVPKFASNERSELKEIGQQGESDTPSRNISRVKWIGAKKYSVKSCKSRSGSHTFKRHTKLQPWKCSRRLGNGHKVVH